jgi:hypothetical protein
MSYPNPPDTEQLMSISIVVPLGDSLLGFVNFSRRLLKGHRVASSAAPVYADVHRPLQLNATKHSVIRKGT